MSTETASKTLPFHLRGNFAPVTEEVTATELEVRGSIPPELCGRYFRNGPNPKTGESPHWFFGDGMVHGIELCDGEARWYRNRYVRTRPYLEGDEATPVVRSDGIADLTSAKANTHVISHAGRILALVESSLPTQLTPELDTVGLFNFGGKLDGPMTAHPKLCPVTGEMHFFGYGFAPPYLQYHRVNSAGELVQSEAIDVSGPTMVHDFAITDRHVIFMDLPIVFSAEHAMQGTMPYIWNAEYGARLGVMPRGGSNADVRWFEIDPCYVFHPLNAWADGDRVTLDVCRYEELWVNGPDDFRPAHLYRFELDLGTGSVREQALDDLPVEFPRVDPRREGLENRYGYAVGSAIVAGLVDFKALVQYDLEKGTSTLHEFGPGRIPGEGVFAPASADSEEDEGWVLSLVYDEAHQASELVVLDASSFDKPPVAHIGLPQRVPFGFHGSWIPDRD